MKIILIAGVPSSQALPGFLITAPPSVCIPDVIGVQTVWIQNQKKKKCLNHPATTDLHAIVITEHHLPFRHTPSYVTKSGWVLMQTPAPITTTRIFFVRGSTGHEGGYMWITKQVRRHVWVYAFFLTCVHI